ncbi:putative polysaccharide biosynthesis protein [Evansella tamaricis]|uniref:Oligosaccharide flippase family protein n=1 Tax=Evansella tamaricis TaxID=2069301 RepID=A0ABS6JAG5_9BACI|nr:oligosaccharide flippase family protein [Evansella tamaricis]
MDSTNEKTNWLKGAIYLSFAAIIVKLLSALYKVPYQNMTGDIGYYVYQQVYPIYGVALVLGSYGFPLVIAKMVSEWSDRDKDLSSYINRLGILFIFTYLLNGSIGIGIIVFAEYIAQLMGDVHLTLAVRWMGLPFFVLPVLAIGRGYYQGKTKMVPTAVSQVVEQVLRVIAILLIASWAMKGNQPYLAGVSAGAGALIGGIGGVLALSLFIKKDFSTLKYIGLKKRFSFPENWKVDVRTLFISGFFVSISAMALVLYQLVDAFSVYRLLETNGMDSHSAAELKGIYDRAWPIVQLGAVVTTVFSYASLPFVTKALASKNDGELKNLISQSVKICFVFGGAASVGLIAIMPHLNSMLFANGEGTFSLQLLASSVLFSALFMTIAALLHALGKAGISFLILVAGLLVKIILNILLVPTFSIEGAAVASTSSFFFLSFMSMMVLRKRKLIIGMGRRFYVKWCFAAFGMYALITFVYFILIFSSDNYFIMSRTLHSLFTLSGVMIGGAFFILVIWNIRLFEKGEWEALPKISKILPYKKND